MHRLIQVYGNALDNDYREWAKNKANELSLVGKFMRMSDGTIDIIISGDPGAIEEFTNACYSGSRYAKVDGLLVKDKTASYGGEPKFKAYRGVFKRSRAQYIPA